MNRAAKACALIALVAAALGLSSAPPRACTIGTNCVLTGGTPPDSGPAPFESFTNLSAGGLFVASTTDFNLPGPMPLVLTRTYRSRDKTGSVWNLRPFGYGVNFNYGIFLYSSSETSSSNSYTDAQVIMPDGGRVYCARLTSTCSQQGCTDYTDATFTCTANPGPFYGATITYDNATTGFDLTTKTGTIYSFGHGAPLQKITDRYQNSITITYKASQISQVADSNGRSLTFTYTGPVVTKVTDNINRSVTYGYDCNNRLMTSTDANGNSGGQFPGGPVTYFYVDNTDCPAAPAQFGDMDGVIDQFNNPYPIYYDNSYRLSQLNGSFGFYGYNYTVNGGTIVECDVTDPRWHLRKLLYNPSGYVTSDTQAADVSAISQTFQYSRDPSNRITVVTDPLGRQTQYTYDAQANITNVTYSPPPSPAPTPSPVAYNYNYGAFSQVSQFSDPLNHTWAASIDPSGSVTAVKDAMSNETQATYYSNGQLKTVTDPLQNTTTYTYNSYGDLATIQDPLGNISTLTADGAGRLTSFRDPARNTTSYAYDNENRIKQVTDANSSSTTYTYDAIGDLTNVMDANGNSIAYTFTFGMGQVSECDANNICRQYNYDALGNLSSVQDGRSLVTQYTYDALNRLTEAQYNFTNVTGYPTSNIVYTPDAGNRLLTAADSNGSGTIMRQYDFLNNLLFEQQAGRGMVTYQYDPASRRSAMTIGQQPPIIYGYDNDNRLTGMTQSGNSVASFGYDADSRRTCLTLPNGVTTSYGYDLDSRLNTLNSGTGSCSSTPNNLGNLTYAYDAAGRVVQAAGVSATINIPAATKAAATYFKNNDINTWNGNTTSLNAGDLINDTLGNTYTYDERDHLSTIATTNSNTVGEFYDAFGRRYQRCSPANSCANITTFLYDGLNPVQETGSDSASLLTGLGLDEYLSRTDTSGAMSFLTDGLGSTIALTNSSGTTTTQYDYEPFGFPTQTLNPNSNPYQFTGREYDPTVAAAGLYYMRGRYYSSRLQRFISQDPIRLNGGDVNFYRYVRNDPVDFSDPTGLLPSGIDVGISGLGSLSDYEAGQDANGCGVDCGPGGFYPNSDVGGVAYIQALTLRRSPRFVSHQGMQRADSFVLKLLRQAGREIVDKLIDKLTDKVIDLFNPSGTPAPSPTPTSPPPPPGPSTPMPGPSPGLSPPPTPTPGSP